MAEKREFPSTSKPDFEMLPPLYRGIFLYGTPTMFVDVLNQPDFSSYDVSTLCGGRMRPKVARPGLAGVS